MRNRVAIIVIALLVFGVGVGAYVVLSGGDDESPAPTSSTTTSTTAFEDTTTTLAATSTTAAAAATSSTTAKATTTKSSTSTTARATTTTVAVAVCGSGKATVSFNAKDLTTDALSSTFTPEATVDNQVSLPIEVAEITVEVTYPGETRTVHFSTAGTVIAPGTTASFTSDKLTSAQRYTSVRFTRFTYFTSGQQASCTVTTP